MQLPNRTKASISSQKLHDYLLSETHPVGRFKAKIFTAVGFTEHTVNSLKEGLLAIAYTGVVVKQSEAAHGNKYVLDGELPTPYGRLIRVRTVWMIDAGEDAPRFITAYPL